MLPRTWQLLKKTTNILLEGVPDGIVLNAVAAALRETPGVQDLHDLHIWAVTSGAPSLSAHLVLVHGAASDDVRVAANRMLDETFEIEHTTLQIESADCRDGREHHGLH